MTVRQLYWKARLDVWLWRALMVYTGLTILAKALALGQRRTWTTDQEGRSFSRSKFLMTYQTSEVWMRSGMIRTEGYSCQFLEPTPDALTCLICTFVARDPQQAICCGKVFCKGCLEALQERHHNLIIWDAPSADDTLQAFPTQEVSNQNRPFQY